jgi:PBSX family phage terminase large subunit
MSAAAPVEETYDAYGAAASLFQRGPGVNEVLLSGPAGTGKSRAVLEYLNWLCMEYRDLRVLMVRKTRRSLTESGMVTLEQKVLHPAQGVQWRASSQRYEYPSGSIIGVAGMDKPGKIMSSEWDIIYVQEATELAEAEWEACTTRLRNGKLPWQQIIGDCNPDAPTHWLRQRAQSGKLLLLDSRHEDNPSVTPEYLARLDELTGVRYLRLRLGIWAAAEGIVYDEWDSATHLIKRFEIPPRVAALHRDRLRFHQSLLHPMVGHGPGWQALSLSRTLHDQTHGRRACGQSQSGLSQ